MRPRWLLAAACCMLQGIVGLFTDDFGIRKGWEVLIVGPYYGECMQFLMFHKNA